MDHEEAIRTRAAERYVARELSPEARGAFEQHFSDCPVCALKVAHETIFLENMRAAVRRPAAGSRR